MSIEAFVVGEKGHRTSRRLNLRIYININDGWKLFRLIFWRRNILG